MWKANLFIGDKVWADPTSLVGSVGVIGSWIGLSKLAKDQGITHNHFTSNEYSFTI